MKPGPPRKPRRVQELLGNPSKRRLRREPMPKKRNAPAPPPWLSAYGLEEWHLVIDELVGMGLAAEIDQAAIGAHCENVSVMRTAAEVLKELATGDASRGLLMKMGSGSVIQSPLIGTYNKARRDVLRSAALLGLCATGRAGIETPDRTSDTDEILRKYFTRSDND